MTDFLPAQRAPDHAIAHPPTGSDPERIDSPLKAEVLPLLRCPDCRAPLDVPVEVDAEGRFRWKPYCVIDCCKPWCVVAGIPVFQHRPRLARLIRAGKHDDALFLMLRGYDFAGRPTTLKGKLADELRGFFLKRRHHQLIARRAPFRAWIDAGFPAATQNVRDYYYFKFTTPKYFAALAVGSTLPAGACLDIGCGAGQITRALSRRGPVTGIDLSFWLLYLARTMIAPDANFVCCDADAPLPFVDGSFASVISSNAFHFIRNQESLLHECRRVADGPVAITSLRHRDHRNAVPNFARTLDGYEALAQACDMSAIIVDERLIVRRYLDGLGPDFHQPRPDAASTPLVTLLLDGARETHGSLESWLHTGEGLNPLYQRQPDGLRLVWPSADFRDDNPDFDYLPETVAADARHPLTCIDLPERYC